MGLLVPQGGGVLCLLEPPRGLDRAKIGRDRFVPFTQARVDVRRHVLGVRYRRRDRRVAVGRRLALARERRRVVGMNEIVREARVIGMPTEERLEDPACLPLAGMGRVARLELPQGDQRQRIERLPLFILRAAPGEAGHRLLVRDEPRAVVRGIAAIVGRDGIGVVTRAGPRAAQPHRALRIGPPLRPFVGLRRRPERVEDAHRPAPVRQGAGRVGGGHRLERGSGLLVPERMQQRHAALEAGLNVGPAGGRKVDVPQPLRGGAGVLVIGLGADGGGDKRAEQQARGERTEHEDPPGDGSSGCG